MFEVLDGDKGFVGMVSRADGTVLQPGIAKYAENARFRDGAAKTRDGVKVLRHLCRHDPADSKFYAWKYEVGGVGRFKDPNRVRNEVILADGDFYLCRDGSTPTTLTTPGEADQWGGWQVQGPVRFVQAYDELLCFRGDRNQPMKLNANGDGFEPFYSHWDSASTTYGGGSVVAWGEKLTSPRLCCVEYPTAGLLPNYVGDLWQDHYKDKRLEGDPEPVVIGFSLVATLGYIYSASSLNLEVGDEIFVTGAANPEFDDVQLRVLRKGAAIFPQGVTTGSATHKSNTLSGLTFTTGPDRVNWTGGAHTFAPNDFINLRGSAPGTIDGVYQITAVNASSFDVTAITGTPGAGTVGILEHCIKGDVAPLPQALAKDELLFMRAAESTAFSFDYDVTFRVAAAAALDATVVYVVYAEGDYASWQIGLYATSDEDKSVLVSVAPKDSGGTKTNPPTLTLESAATIGRHSKVWKVIETVTPHTTPATAFDAADRLTITEGAGILPVGTTIRLSGFTPTGGSPINGTWNVQTDLGGGQYQLNSPSGGAVALQGPATVNGIIEIVTIPAGQEPGVSNIWAASTDHTAPAKLATFMQNRVITSRAYDNNYLFRKRDYVAACDLLDPLTTYFTNEFRINEGDDDEIIDFTPYTDNNLVVFKSRSVHLVSSVSGDLSGVRRDTLIGNYGLVGEGAFCVAGRDILFFSNGRGLVSLQQTSEGRLQGVDLPFSDAVQDIVDSIDWSRGSQIRVAYNDNKVYCAVPIDDGTDGNNAVLVYDYLNGQWSSKDTGSWRVKEWFIYWDLDIERLGFVGWDNGLYAYEALFAQDEILNEDSDNPEGIDVEEISFRLTTRNYRPDQIYEHWALQRIDLNIDTWAPTYSVSMTPDGFNESAAVISGRTKSRLKYYRPFSAADWDPTNVNDDHGTPYRQDYSIELSSSGPEVYNAGGIYPGARQRITEVLRPRPREGVGIAIDVTNTTGFFQLNWVSAMGRVKDRRYTPKH